MTLRTLNYGNFGIFLIMGNAGFCPSTVIYYFVGFGDTGTWYVGPSPNTQNPDFPGQPGVGGLTGLVISGPEYLNRVLIGVHSTIRNPKLYW